MDEVPSLVSDDEVFSALSSASRRTRRVLIAIQVFSLLVAVMIFNSWSLNWTGSRLETARDARLLYQCCSLPTSIGYEVAENQPGIVTPAAQSDSKRLSSGWVKGCLEGVSAPTPDRGARRSQCMLTDLDGLSSDLSDAAKFVMQRGYSQQDIEKYLKALEGFRFDNVSTFPVPLIGVRIDVNGLGLFAGLGFATLFLWFGLSLRREVENLGFLAESRWNDSARDLIRIESLFAPHSPKESVAWRHRLLELIPSIAMLMPLALLLIQLLNDSGFTFQVGSVVDASLARATVALEVVLLFLNLVLVRWCHTAYKEMLVFWEEAS